MTVITYFVLQRELNVLMSMTSSQDIPVGDPFHLVHLEVNSIGTYAGNKSDKVKMKALQGHQSTCTLPQEGCRNYTLIGCYKYCDLVELEYLSFNKYPCI